MWSDKMLKKHIILIPFPNPNLEKSSKKYIWLKMIKKNFVQDLVEDRRSLCCKQKTLAQRTGFQCQHTGLMPFYLNRALGESFPILSSPQDRRNSVKNFKGLDFNLLTQQSGIVLWICRRSRLWANTKVQFITQPQQQPEHNHFLLFPQALIHTGQWNKNSVTPQGR